MINDNRHPTGRRGLAALGMLFALILAGPAAAADAAAGKSLYGVCAACHGPDGEGNKQLNAPRLTGQQDWYLIRQIKNFKAGIRGAHQEDIYGQQMAPMANMLPDDAAIENVVAYIETFTGEPAPPSSTGDAAKGKALYAVCATCHGQKAEGVEALNGPRLAGQEDWYLVRQIKNFKAGIRGAHPQDTFGQQMAPMANMLADDQAIADVVAYITSLR